MEISRGHRLVSFRSLSCRLEASICGELTQPDSRLNQVPPFVVYPGLTTQWLLTWRWTGETLGPLWTRSQPRGTTGELHVCGGILGLACFHTWPHFFEILSPDSWSSPTSFDYSFLVSSLILINRCPANADSLSQTLIQGVRSPKALLPCSLWPGSPKLFSVLWCGYTRQHLDQSSTVTGQCRLPSVFPLALTDGFPSMSSALSREL